MAQVFADELKAWRVSLRLTQADAAACLKIPLRTYQEWEQGRDGRGPRQEGPIRALMEQAEKGR